MKTDRPIEPIKKKKNDNNPIKAFGESIIGKVRRKIEKFEKN